MFKGVTAAEDERIWEILEFIELTDKANNRADTLSHGERQWLEMGMLVASNPKLLLLDEPTTGMTDAGKRRTADLIQRIAKNHTVLLVEHDMHLVRQLARKVTVMHQGQLLAEGTLAEVVENELVKAVYLGKGGRH
jgi:urea transport system ATP-binding protein